MSGGGTMDPRLEGKFTHPRLAEQMIDIVYPKHAEKAAEATTKE